MKISRKKSKPHADNRGYLEPDIIRGSYNDDIQEISLALSRDPSCIKRIDNETGGTALHIAGYRGNLTIASLLLEQPGVDLHARDRLGRDPVDVAVQSGHPTLSKLMLRFLAASLNMDGSKVKKPLAAQSAKVLQLKLK